MSEIYVLADTHFGHKNIHKFRVKSDGSSFASSDEHDEFLMDMWNTYIPGGSKVYLLGDAAFNEAGLHRFHKLNGDKAIIKGNHDLAVQTLQKYFGQVDAMKTKKVGDAQIIMTHIPIHFSSMERWHLNIHGHTHMQHVPDSDRHFNVSIEALDYVPITLDEVVERVIKATWFTKEDNNG